MVSGGGCLERVEELGQGIFQGKASGCGGFAKPWGNGIDEGLVVVMMVLPIRRFFSGGCLHCADPSAI
ncbi:hypothetical protein D3C81_2239180 [compost metagenome]